MKSRRTRSPRRNFERLPAEIQNLARPAYQLFREDPRHPGLRFRNVHPSMPIYSARITRDYRAVCVLKDDTAVWFFIGSHEDYDRLLRSL